MIQHLTIKVNIDIFQNIFAIISFILYNILVNTVNLGTIIVIIIFEFFHLLLYHTFTLFIPLLFLTIYIFIASEETYHIAMITFLGKQDSISHIDITKVNLGFFSFIGGVSVCYNGMFKKSDIFYISLAGPVMPLFYSFLLGLILFIVNLVTSIDTILLIKLLFFSSLAPALAFIPLNRQNYLSDGYQIKLFICTNKVPFKKILSAITYTVKSMLFFTINSLKGKK